MGVIECLAYAPHPTYMVRIDDEVQHVVFESFGQAVVWQRENGAGVLMGIHAVPINPSATLADAWVANHLEHA